MEKITVAIPVDSHVKKYLMNTIFVKKPIRLSLRESFGILLYQFLETKRNNRYMPYKASNVIEVHLTFHQNYRVRMFMPHHKAVMFNKLIDSRIKEEFDVYMDSVLKHKPDAMVDRLIRAFELKYDLADTKLSFQTLKRRYFRNRKRLSMLDKSL